MAIVDEEDATAGCDAAGDKRPEGGDALTRDVRQPEREKHDIEGAGNRRLPGEEIGFDVGDVITSDAPAGSLDLGHLGEPLSRVLGTAVIAAAALPPLVVLRGPAPVERLLFGQQ